jgi:methionyl-tRNA formyltransferase
MAHHLKILFAGTPTFAAKHLQALLDAKFNICAVITQPDKPAGRGRKLQPSPVKQLAMANHLATYQPTTLRDQDIQQVIQKLQPDIIVDVACGLLVPKEILDLPRYGCINVHPSLLPRWRGATPIQHAILAGDQQTGISIMQMDEGWDTGPVLLQKTCPIKPDDTTAILLEKLAEVGITALIEVLTKLEQNGINAEKQSDNAACYAKKINKEAGRINWQKSAIELDREIRAYNPWPIAFTEIGGQIVRIWQAAPTNNKANDKPGTILQLNKQSIDVATGDGILRIYKMQFPGGKVLSIVDLLHSKKDFFINHRSFH